MTLTARLLLFSLGTLGLVLVGFSVGVYLLARADLHRQADARLAAGIDALSAAIEFEPGGEPGLEWEPDGRFSAFPGHLIGGQGHDFVWAATGPDGQVLGGSPGGWTADLLGAAGGDLFQARPLSRSGRAWLVRRHGYADNPANPGPLKPGRYPEIAITAALSLDPVAATLRRLAGGLAGLSAAVWVAALLLGRAVCRRALRPLAGMADAARTMPADDPHGRLPVGPARDELADLGRAFNGLLDRLGEAHERQRRFTAEASHQLRTPLTALIGQVEVALRRDRPAADYRQALAAARAEAGRLAGLVETLLFLARADADAAAPGRERLDLSAWLPAQLQPWAAHPRAADLHAVPAGPAWVELPPLLLGELLTNLIDNALKYSPPGTPVTLRVVGGDGTTGVEVADRGSGIAPADLPDLFRPFVRTADARRRGVPGVGLGLAVVARLAAACGGAVEVDSEPGAGSTFRVRLPRVPPPGDGHTSATGD